MRVTKRVERVTIEYEPEEQSVVVAWVREHGFQIVHWGNKLVAPNKYHESLQIIDAERSVVSR